MQYMKSAEMYVKCFVILMDHLGLRIFFNVINERTSFASPVSTFESSGSAITL